MGQSLRCIEFKAGKTRWDVEVLASAKVLPATVRAYPAIANGQIYIRNEKTLVCLSLK